MGRRQLGAETARYWQRSAGAVNEPPEEYSPLTPRDGPWP